MYECKESYSKRIANKDAGYMVDNLKPFTGSNMFAKLYGNSEWVDETPPRLVESPPHLYVVFSYGQHFPMYIYDKESDLWLGNSDKVSKSTARQMAQARPSRVDVWLSNNDMRDVFYHGSYKELIIEKART